MALNWYSFSGCCSGTTFQVEAPKPPYNFSSGNTYYLITDQYTGCSQYLSSGYASGTTIYNLQSGSTLSFTSCTQCISTYPCVPGPTPTPTITPTTTQTCPNLLATITTGSGNLAIDSVYNPINNLTYIVDSTSNNVEIIDNYNLFTGTSSNNSFQVANSGTYLVIP